MLRILFSYHRGTWRNPTNFKKSLIWVYVYRPLPRGLTKEKYQQKNVFNPNATRWGTQLYSLVKGKLNYYIISTEKELIKKKH